MKAGGVRTAFLPLHPLPFADGEVSQPKAPSKPSKLGLGFTHDTCLQPDLGSNPALIACYLWALLNIQEKEMNRIKEIYRFHGGDLVTGHVGGL